MNKYRFHLLGLTHLPCSREYMSCAFTQKNFKLARMLLSLGHEVIYYGAEGSMVPCTRFVQTHTLEDIRREWGDGDERFEIGYNWKKGEFRADFNGPLTATSLKFYDRCVQEINETKRPDDFLLMSQGIYHKPIADQVGLFLKCEPGIGYMGSFPENFRCFESNFLRSYAVGSESPGQCASGKYYDRVIPNYFEREDFDFSARTADYFLYIGRLIRRKGLIIAYHACQELGKQLVIAGQGGRVTKDGHLVSSDPEFCLPPGNWQYMGYAGPVERNILMGGAIATFVPTEYLEPFAGTHVESMLCGTPPITTDFGVFPETIPDCVEGVVGFRCNTLDDFVRAGRSALGVDRFKVRQYATRFLTERVRWDFQKWFDDLHRVYLSTTDSSARGWHHVEPCA
jgi:glycosyltransferase involved in cell wall biosynthesis